MEAQIDRKPNAADRRWLLSGKYRRAHSKSHHRSHNRRPGSGFNTQPRTAGRRRAVAGRPARLDVYVHGDAVPRRRVAHRGEVARLHDEVHVCVAQAQVSNMLRSQSRFIRPHMSGKNATLGLKTGGEPFRIMAGTRRRMMVEKTYCFACRRPA